MQLEGRVMYTMTRHMTSIVGREVAADDACGGFKKNGAGETRAKKTTKGRSEPCSALTNNQWLLIY